MMEKSQCTQKNKSILQIFEDINNQIIEEAFKVFDNAEPHQVLIGIKLDNSISLFIYIL